MNLRHQSLLIVSVACLAPVSMAVAGENPFVVGVTARTVASIDAPPVTQDTNSDFVADVNGLPATASSSVQDASATVSATFTEFKLWAEHTSSVTSGFDFGDATASANDTVTINSPGAPTGSTRLEMTWHLDGELTGLSSLIASSAYRPNTSGTGDTTTQAGFILISDPGTVNQDITFVYDNIPIGSPWNISTTGKTTAQVLGVADFDETISLKSVQLFVDNVPYHAGMAGVSGTVYSVLGDLDGDGFVGINDLNLVLGNWNQNVPPADPLADPSGDGFVGIDDLNLVLGNWNAGTPPVAVAAPEPASLALLGVGSTLITLRKRPAC